MFQAFECIMYFYQSKLASQKSGTAYALAYIASSIFRIVGILIHADIKWFAFAMSLDFIMLAFFLLTAYFKEHNRFCFSFKRAKQLLNKSYHYIFAGILVVIYGKVTDILLLGKMIDETNVGYYAAATTLCNAWPFVLTAIIDSANPLIIDLYKENEEAFNKRIRQLYAAIFYISTIVAILIALLSDLIISILYGQNYLPASVPMKIFAWSTGFAYLGVARTAWMQCKHKTKYETYIALFGAIVNIVMNYILMQFLAQGGIALATVISTLFNNSVLLWLLKKENMTRNYGAVAISFFRNAAAAFGCGFAAFSFCRRSGLEEWATRHWSNELILLFTVGMTVVAAYIAVVFILGSREIKELFALFRRKK